MQTEEKARIFDIVEQTYQTSHDLTDVWTEFFSKFQRSIAKEGDLEFEKPYLEQIKRMSGLAPWIYEKLRHKDSKADSIGRKIFQLNYADLVDARDDLMGLYDDDENTDTRELHIKLLCYQIRNDYDQALSDIKKSVFSLLQIHNKKYADALGSEEVLEIEVENFEITKTITEIGGKDLDKFIRVKGIISQFDDQGSLDIVRTGWTCDNCSALTETKTRKQPKKCSNCDEDAGFTESRDARRVIDFMYFQIQDLNERNREGRALAPPLNICINGTEMVQSIYKIIENGFNVAVNGVIRIQEITKPGSNITGWELECHGIEFIDESTIYDEELKAEAEREIEEDQMDDHFRRFVRSIAPHLQGLDDHKEVLALTLVGADSWTSPEGTRIRGEANAAFIGDPSTAKSELAHAAELLSPGSTYVQGSNASKVGLTASISTTEVLRGGVIIKKSSLNAGVYGYTKSGKFAIIDELDKVSSSEHYEAISSATDDFQTMYVHKNAVHTRIPVYCGSIFCGNPITNGGKYDVTQDVFSQFNWATWLWSRIDLPFLHLAKRTDESRLKMWENRAKMEQNLIREDEQDKRRRTKTYKFGDEELYTYDYLIHEIAYLRSTYHPKIEQNSLAWMMLQRFWNWWNSRNIMPPDLQSKKLFIPVLDERKINSIRRYACMHARLHRRNEVTTQDMAEVLRLFKISIQMFTPQVDHEDAELKAIAASTVILDRGLKEAIRHANREMKEQIGKFTTGLRKTIHYLHNAMFHPCSMCKGRGYIDDEAIICYGCNGARGNYGVFTYRGFVDDICRPANVTVYAEDYFKLLKQAGFIDQDSNKAFDMKASFSGTWKIMIDLRSRAINQINEHVNKLFELEVDTTKTPIMGTAYDDLQGNQR